MKEILDQINEISKYGLFKNLDEENKELNFEIEYKYDEKEYPEFYNTKFLKVRENIESYFPNFGYYKIANEITDIEDEAENQIG